MKKKHLTCAHTKAQLEFNIESGFDAKWVVNMYSAWGAEKVKVLADLLTKNPDCTKDRAKYAKLLSDNNMEDAEWDWLRKSAGLNSSEYHWFYLIAENTVQAVCIIYHPVNSQFDKEKIFYVDYLSTAYWNRDRPGYDRRFAGLGPILLAYSIKYAIDVLKYRPGFSLHSLPNAEKFYTDIGMKEFGRDSSKENLKFFEAEEKIAVKIVERVYA